MVLNKAYPCFIDRRKIMEHREEMWEKSWKGMKTVLVNLEILSQIMYTYLKVEILKPSLDSMLLIQLIGTPCNACLLTIVIVYHDDVIKWKHFPRYWPSSVNSPHKGQWRGAMMFILSTCTWINGWANNRGAGGLRRHRAHYDVTVILWPCHVERKRGVT